MPNKGNEKATHQLEDLEVREVSVVDKPANRRRFLIVKMEDVMARAAIPAFERDERGWTGDPADPIVKTDGVDGEIDLLALAEEMAEEFSVPEGDGETQDEEVSDGLEAIFKATKAGDTAKRINGLVATLTRAINAMKGLGDKPLTPTIGRALQTVARGLTMLAGEKEAGVKKVAGGAVQAATTALEKLMQLASSLKEMDASADVPEAATGQMKGIASVLASILSQAEAGSTAPDKGKEKPAVDAEKGKDKKKEEGGKKEEGKDKTTKSDDEDDPIIVFKAGAKMRRARLSRFRKAVETLSMLLKELEEGDQQELPARGKDKDKKKTQKAETEIVEDLLEGITKAIEAIGGKLEEVNSSLQEQVGAVTKRLDELENVRPTGEGDDDPPEPVEKKRSMWGNVIGTRRA